MGWSTEGAGRLGDIGRGRRSRCGPLCAPSTVLVGDEMDTQRPCNTASELHDTFTLLSNAFYVNPKMFTFPAGNKRVVHTAEDEDAKVVNVFFM